MNSTQVHQLFPAQLLNSMVYYVVITDVTGKCLYVNGLAQTHLSHTSKDLLNTFFSDTIYPGDIGLYTEAAQSCIQTPDTHTSVAIRKAKQTKKDEDHWIRWELSGFTNEDRIVGGIVYMGHDIIPVETTGKRIYEVAENEETLDSKKFRSLVNHIPGVIYRCLGDEFFSLQYFSDEIEKLTGYPVDYFIQNPKDGYLRIVHDDYRALLKEAISHAVTGKEKFELEYKIITKNGELRWVIENGQGVYEAEDQVIYVDGCIFDITNRKQTESALQKSKDEIKRLALVAQNTTNAVMVTDAEENITWINAGYTRVTGYTIEDIRGKKIGYSLVEPEMKQRIRTALDNKLPYKNEFLSHTKNGDAIWLEVDCQPLTDEQGRHLGFMAIETDITQRKQTLKQQEELLQRLTLATDSAEIGIFEIDLSTNEVIWDDRMYAIYGYPLDTELSLFKVFGSALHPDDAEMMRNIIGELLSQKKEINGAVYRIILPDGKTKYIESHAIIKKSESGKIISLIGTNRDITDDVLVQEKIKTQNKILREIAFSQSHEVRRPLANILGVIEVLRTSGAINDLEIFEHLAESANQLDMQIRNIVNKTNSIDDEAFR